MTATTSSHMTQGGGLNVYMRDFLGGAVVKNLPAKAGDMGSVPGPGRFRMLQRSEAHAQQILSP